MTDQEIEPNTSIEVNLDGSQSNDFQTMFLTALESMQNTMKSSNEMIREFVRGKRPLNEESQDGAKRAKHDPKEDRLLASQKAHSSASHEANTSSDEETEPPQDVGTKNSQNDDDVSLYGDSDLDEDESEGKGDNADNDDLLDLISIALDASEEKGPNISEKLAKIMNESYQSELSTEKRKEIGQKYKIPGNCTEIIVPKLNTEIWTKLKSNAKRSDIRMSALQDTLNRASSAILVSANDLLSHRKDKTKPDYKTIISRLTDSVALVGQVHKEISFKRREAIRPYLHADYKQACARTVKPGKLLFGEDLSKTLQELKSTNKIMNSATSSNASRPTNKPQQGYNMQYHNSQNNQNRSFLRAKGRNPFSPKQKEPNQYKKKYSKQ